jgi:hypothetical protein
VTEWRPRVRHVTFLVQNLKKFPNLKRHRFFKTPKKKKNMGTRAFSSFWDKKGTYMTREENFVKLDG